MKDGTPCQENGRALVPTPGRRVIVIILGAASLTFVGIGQARNWPFPLIMAAFVLTTIALICALIWYYFNQNTRAGRAASSTVGLTFLALCLVSLAAVALKRIAPFALALGSEAWAWLASITRLEWILIIAGFLVWRELAAIRRLIALLAQTATDRGNPRP